MINPARIAKAVTFVALIAVIASLTACGGTKVYTAQKSIVYKDNIYSLANVSKVSSRMQGRINDEDVNMKGMEKKEVNALLDEHEMIIVSTIFDLDDQELVYQRVKVDSWREFDTMVRNMENAQKKITKFMADGKKTQLKL